MEKKKNVIELEVPKEFNAEEIQLAFVMLRGNHYLPIGHTDPKHGIHDLLPAFTNGLAQAVHMAVKDSGYLKTPEMVLRYCIDLFWQHYDWYKVNQP